MSIKALKKISRQGVPHYVAPWYSDLTPQGKALIGQNRIMTVGETYRRNLTEVEYQHHYADGTPAHADPEVREAVRQHIAEKAKAIATYEAGHLVTTPEERIAA